MKLQFDKCLFIILIKPLMIFDFTCLHKKICINIQVLTSLSGPAFHLKRPKMFPSVGRLKIIII